MFQPPHPPAQAPRRKEIPGKLSLQEGLQNSHFQTFLRTTPKSIKKLIFFCQAYTTISAAAPLLHSCAFDKHHALALCYFALSWKKACYGLNHEQTNLQGDTAMDYEDCRDQQGIGSPAVCLSGALKHGKAIERWQIGQTPSKYPT